MTKRIIYKDDNDNLVVITSTGLLPLEEVARKDVPAGVAYKIIDTVDVPTDLTFRDAWDADFSAPHGHGIGAEAWFAEQAAKENIE